MDEEKDLQKKEISEAGENAGLTDNVTEDGAGTGKKNWIGKGIYTSKDVPIRLLDKFIIGAIAVVIVLVVWFAVHGGYVISFDTDGGSTVDSQTLKHGDLVEEPQDPVKAGYDFVCWVTSDDESLAEEWDFDSDTIEEELTLYAVWEASTVTVKFDLDGGTVDGADYAADIEVVYGGTYGELPVPEKEGYTFDGWVYGGEVIDSDTIVTMTGEHVLTARWI